MKYLLIRHAESEYGIGLSPNLDSMLSDFGMKQICITSKWLDHHYPEIKDDFIGFTSPYLRVLQTASILNLVLDIDFSINIAISEFKFKKSTIEGFEIKNRSADYANLHWPNTWYDKDSVFVPYEELESFIDNLSGFIKKLDSNNNYMFVSHGITLNILKEIILGTNKEEIVNKYINKQITTMPYCGMTLIDDGKIEWESKVVY